MPGIKTDAGLSNFTSGSSLSITSGGTVDVAPSGSLFFPTDPFSDFNYNVSAGKVAGAKTVNKYGSAPNGVQSTLTDIWSRANASPTQQIWIAPTQARIHTLTSNSVSDIGSPVGSGARTLRVYGLKTWDLAETSEVVTMNGTGSASTVNSYVIIHRMKVLTSGSTAINVGTIIATAASDATVTATILPTDGQTEMAIYGVPSIQTAYLLRWSAALDRASAAVASIAFQLRVNENPNVQLKNFIRKDDIAVSSVADNRGEHRYAVYPKYPGPCIIKVQAIGSTTDLDGESAFDLILEDN